MSSEPNLAHLAAQIEALREELGRLTCANRESQEELDRLACANRELQEEVDQFVKDRTEYLQNVSHQLVAPLNAIKWHIENLTEGRIGVERARKVLRSIYSQATIAVHLAKNFALMSNLDADHSLSALKEPLQEVNLCRLMVNLADDFQPLAWDKSVHIEVVDRPLAEAPSVLAMKPLVSQVFSNVIENAVKYSNPSTKIVIDGSFDSQKDTVSVRVRNWGIPLNKSDAPRVFDRGFRSAEAKEKYPAGTGFGLFIAKRIVEIHEGSVSALSPTDGAVEFIVTLPVKALMGKARLRGDKEHSGRR